MKFRKLKRTEIGAIWQIDRGEVVENIFYHEDGRLVLRPEFYDMSGWPNGEAEQYGPILDDCFDRGGSFLGAFDDDVLVGMSVLEEKFIGQDGDQLQLTFLHVGRAYRKQGLGKTLFDQAVQDARARGAKRLYVSATPSENTINFYFHLGCVLAEEPDPELYKLEPYDIHLDYVIPS